MKVSIICPVTRPNLLDRMVTALDRQTAPKTSYEVVLVTARASSVLREGTSFAVRVVTSESPHPSVRRNLGVTHASGEILAFMDDDVDPPNHCVERVLTLFEDDGVDIVCGSETGEWDSSLGQRLANAIIHAGPGEIGIQKYFRLQGPSFNEISLCNCALRRSVFVTAGGFNEHADYHVDDTEFFFIATRLGFRAIKDPLLNVAHLRRPFPFSFFVSQFKKRIATGRNVLIFPEVFTAIPYTIPLLVIGTVLPLIGVFSPLVLAWLIALYGIFLLITTFTVPNQGRLLRVLLPFGMALNHCVTYVGTMAGLISGCWDRWMRHADFSLQRKRISRAF